MNNEKLKLKTDELNRIIEKYSGSVYKENTELAIAYFIRNKESLKYLASAYTINNRHKAMIDHLVKHFGCLDLTAIKRMLNSSRIYSNKWINFLTYILPAILLLLTVITVSYITYSFVVLIFSTIIGCILYIIIGYNLEIRNKTCAITYKLCDQYKYLVKPSKQL